MGRNWTTVPVNQGRGSSNDQVLSPLILVVESPYCSEIEGWEISLQTFFVGSQWLVIDAHKSH